MKEDINSLKDAIRTLKSKQALELEALKSQFLITYESLKPINFIKNTVHEVVTSPEIRTDLMNNILGVATGYLSKLIVVGTSHNPVLKVAGALLQQGIGNIVANHGEQIFEVSENIFQKVLKYRFKPKSERFLHSIIKYREFPNAV